MESDLMSTSALHGNKEQEQIVDWRAAALTSA